MARQGKLSGFAWHVEYHPESIQRYNPKRKRKKKNKKNQPKKIGSSIVKIDCIFVASSNICTNILGEYYDTVCKNSSMCSRYKKKVMG